MFQHVGRNLLGRVSRIVAPVVGINLVADRDVSHVLGKFERTHLIFCIRFLIDGIRRAKEYSTNSQAARKQPLGEIQFHLHVARSDVTDIGMRKRVIPDLMSLAINAAGQTPEIIRLQADQEKCCGRMLTLQNIEHLRSPLRIGAVIKRDRQLLPARSVTRHPIRFGQSVKGLKINQTCRGIYFQIAFALGGPRLNPQNLSLPFHIDILPGRNLAQLVDRVYVARHVPHAPQRTILRTQSPQSKRLDPERLRRPHLI